MAACGKGEESGGQQRDVGKNGCESMKTFRPVLAIWTKTEGSEGGTGSLKQQEKD